MFHVKHFYPWIPASAGMTHLGELLSDAELFEDTV